MRPSKVSKAPEMICSLVATRLRCAMCDVDIHLLNLLLQFVLLLGQVFPAGGSDNLGGQCLERIEFGRIERQIKYRVDFVLYFELLLRTVAYLGDSGSQPSTGGDSEGFEVARIRECAGVNRAEASILGQLDYHGVCNCMIAGDQNRRQRLRPGNGLRENLCEHRVECLDDLRLRKRGLHGFAR